MEASASTETRFITLMEKASAHPNTLTDKEMKELAFLIPTWMIRMHKKWKEEWFDSFSNHTFIQYLMNWKPSSGKQIDSQEVIGFGELCRQAYKCGALFRLLGNLPLRSDVLATIQVEIEAELQDGLKPGFFEKLFGIRPTIKIPLDTKRLSNRVSNENRLKLENLIADSLLDVICKSGNHPCNKEIKSTYPELVECRNDAKLSILRTLEVTIGAPEVQFTIAKSCRKNEESEKKKLLDKLKKIQASRQKFFQEARQRGIIIAPDYVQESQKQLQRAKNLLEQADARGLDVTFAYDMVALTLSNEKSYEAYLLSQEYLNRHHEISWMKVSLGFSSSIGNNKASSSWINEADTLFSKQLTIPHLEKLNQHVVNLRKVTITPMSLLQVVKESDGLLAKNTQTSFQSKIQRLQSAHDPNQIEQFQKIQNEIYSSAKGNQNQVNLPKSPIFQSFIDTYEKEVLEPKLTFLENVCREVPTSACAKRNEIMQQIEEAKRHQNIKFNIEQIEATLRDAVKQAVKKDSQFLATHTACKQFAQTDQQ